MFLTRFSLNCVFSLIFIEFLQFFCLSIFRKCVYKHDIHRIIREFILRNFIEITNDNEDVLRLSSDDLVDIINEDALNAKNEEPIWEFCLRWIEFDEKNRFEHVTRLLESVRLGLINQDVGDNHHYNISNDIYLLNQIRCWFFFLPVF